MRPNNVYLATLFQNHLGNITHAWTGIDVKGNPLCPEAKATLLVLPMLFPSPLILPFFCLWRSQMGQSLGLPLNNFVLFSKRKKKLAIEETKPPAKFYAINNYPNSKAHLKMYSSYLAKSQTNIELIQVCKYAWSELKF